MIQNFLVILSCTPALLGLGGLFSILKNGMGIPKDPLPPGADREPRPGIFGDKLPAMDLPTIRAAGTLVSAVLSEPSWAGVTALAAVIATVFVSGYVVMFVDLALPAMIGLGLVTIAAAIVSVTTIGRRYAAGAWLPPGMFSNNGDAIPVPSRNPDYRDMQESVSPFRAPGLPEEASLATLERY
jgi:hypothetical protein